MDFFYVPWISSLEPEEALEGNEPSVTSIPESLPVLPKYKLTFFGSKGLAEISRLILVYAGEPFIDNRIHYDKWLEMKNGLFLEFNTFINYIFAEFLFQQLPILEVNGHILCNAVAIARFLGRQFGLSGRTAFEEAEVDGVMEILALLAVYFRPCVFSLLKKRYSKAQFEKVSQGSSIEYSVPTIHKYLRILENYASRKTLHGFLFPSGLTYADFAITVCYELIDNIFPQMMISYTSLRALRDKVNELPELQHYLKTRPRSIF